MTLRLLKSRQITPWNTLPWKRPESSLGHWVLAAASLFPLSGAVLPAFAAEEAAGVSSVTPLEQVRQETAQQRWERLKSRYEPANDAVPAATARTDVLRGSALPVPESEDAFRWSAKERNYAPPLPDSADEPAWVVTGVPVAPVTAAPVARFEPQQQQQQSFDQAERPIPVLAKASAEPRVLTDTLDESSPQGAIVAVQAADPSQGNPAADPAIKPQDSEMPAYQTRRQLRKIGDIRPFYDIMVDEDIRKAANRNAEEYGVSFGDEPYHPRAFPDTAMAWEPSNYYHYPLYFEDAVLERYGHTYPAPIQPFVSVAKFSGQLLALPYQMTLDPVNKEMYALGWYRPGEVAPKLKYQIPLNAQAAAVQAGVTTGLIFLIP